MAEGKKKNIVYGVSLMWSNQIEKSSTNGTIPFFLIY